MSDAPEGEVHFQWGRIPGTYREGAPIAWLTRPGGDPVPPFRYVMKKGRFAWNYGTPGYADVIALDTDPETPPAECPGCGQAFAAIGIEVSGGIIAGGIGLPADAYHQRFGDDAAAFDIAVRASDGSWTPQPDWAEAVLSEFDGETE